MIDRTIPPFIEETAMIAVFDINETVLDVAALSPLFEELFGDETVRTEWFLMLEELWMTATLTDRYQPFGTLACSALRRAGLQRNVTIGEKHERRLMETLKTLPPHPDAAPALAELRKKGYRLTALTNGTLEAVEHQLDSAGLRDAFDAVLSVDTVACYKPGRAPYQHAADRWGVSTQELVMIAAHGWDLIGAASAGCKTGFVARPGKAIDPQLFQPDWQADTLDVLVHRIAP